MELRQLVLSVLGVVGLIGLSGCVHVVKPRVFHSLAVGMEKSRVVHVLGEPKVVRGSTTNKQGKVVEVWEYSVVKPRTNIEIVGLSIITIFTLGLAFPIFFLESEEPYCVYFSNEKLMQWGKSGDWEKETHNIQEVRVAPVYTF